MLAILVSQEAEIRKSAGASSSQDPILIKRAGGVTQYVGPEFKSQYWKKKW
jgi:hypothetical protein